LPTGPAQLIIPHSKSYAQPNGISKTEKTSFVLSEGRFEI